MSSAEQTDLSGSQTDLSGSQTDLSGSQTDLSGSQTDLSGSQTDLSGSQTDLSGSQTDLSGSQMTLLNAINPSAAGIQSVETVSSTTILFSLDDLLNDQQLISQKEVEDKQKLLAFVNPPFETLKPSLYQWARAGFPDLYCIRSVNLSPPSLCSDGISRPLLVYYEYLMEMSMADSLLPLHSKVQGMNFTFSHDGSSSISLHVSKV